MESNRNISIIICCASSESADEHELDALYDQLEEVIHSDKSKHKFIIGDHNTTLGKANKIKYRIGKFGLGEVNRNRIVLQDFCLRHVSSTEIHFPRRNNIAARYGSYLMARHLRRSTIYLQTEDGAHLAHPQFPSFRTGYGHRLLRAKI
ncbi:hypothetical protein KIN20_019744 [Parelaphostrongylus tenuis]|uniref:Endonuclease/exonuclease/phosphatase domain-containing protein n=1 Tax=Parelaphostrongylus tenuis TaxID=148309 RepID=A0AAD5N924_PARTN|nr:hypothetical protein KIN20_019744 [Parelaphostrongylus tenuis]